MNRVSGRGDSLKKRVRLLGLAVTTVLLLAACHNTATEPGVTGSVWGQAHWNEVDWE